MSQMDSHASQASIVLTGGHESRAGLDLAGLASHGWQIVPTGQALHQAVIAALEENPLPVCVVPMTLGRDTTLVADTARTLQWINRTAGAARIALTEPFGTQDHLIAWLRRILSQAIPTEQPSTAAIVWASAAGPFDDADLFRVARLVSQYQRQQWIEVAFAEGNPDLTAVVERCKRLGAQRIVLLPANFSPQLKVFDVLVDPVPADGGPLLPESAIVQVINTRAEVALQQLINGNNGIHAGMHAEHGHGYPHSHDHESPTQHGQRAG